MADEATGGTHEGEEEPRAADGRVPGRRGRQTRQRLLDCTSRLLEEETYRELRVVDIAREAGTSPATFYQYFPDVEAAILALAEEMAAEGDLRLTAIVTTGSWKGAGGYRTAESIADAYIRFWEDNSGLMRVIDLTAEEGDGRFRAIRTMLLNRFMVALAAVMDDEAKRSDREATAELLATAGVLVSMLSHVAAHRYGFEAHGISADSLRTAMARILYTAVTGKKAPA